jgi:hypothetical protein
MRSEVMREVITYDVEKVTATYTHQYRLMNKTENHDTQGTVSDQGKELVDSMRKFEDE